MEALQCQHLLGKLRETALFSRSGEQRPSDESVALVHSWQEATAMRTSLEVGNVHLEARNEVFSYLDRVDRSLGRRWNDLVNVIKPQSDDLAASKTRQLMEAHQLPERFLHSVQWDLLHLCMMEEYAEVFRSPFFVTQLGHYLDCRFPCGWEGPWPGGKFIVF